MKDFTRAAVIAGLVLACGGTLAPAGAQVTIETPPEAAPFEGGSMQGKAPNAPATSAMTLWVMRHTPRRGEWVTIPVGSVKLHTWIAYPDGTDPRPVVLVMNGVAGMWDDFPRGLADQLAQDGFIAVVPDLVSGMGPNGGNWESFGTLELAVQAHQRVGVQQALGLLRGARDYALTLPRANGKSATLGIAFGGTVSFAAAALLPGVNAAVVFDGAAPDTATLGKITAPVIYFGGALDDRAVATVGTAAAALTKLGKRFEYHIYSETTSEFIAFGVPGNNTRANAAAWPRAIAFLRANTQ